jgi:TFIIF-interacting CTD phosphatase-like protein
MWDPEARFSFLVKLRPFFKEFIRDAMNDYKVYFYTAAQSGYAKKILEILKLEMGPADKLVD